jgi:FkbM family methyltransferase
MMYGRNSAVSSAGVEIDDDAGAADMALSLQYDEAKLIRDYFARHPRVGNLVDVGAHTGTSFRQYLNEGWRVLAFEPDSSKFEKLRPYLGQPKFELMTCAVGDKADTNVQFYTSPESTGIASLVPFRDSHVPAERVQQTTLAGELKKRSMRQIDFLKIDTEGYDLLVLRGHDWTVRPEVILTEFDEVKTRHLGTGYRDIADLLKSNGYTVFCSQWAPLVRYGSGHTWTAIGEYPCDLQHADAWGNFVAVRDDAGVETMRALVGPHL